MATQNPEITDRKMAYSINHLQTQHMHKTCNQTILLTHLIMVLSNFTVAILLNLLYMVVFHLSLPIFLILLHKVAILLQLLHRVVFDLTLPNLLKIKMETYLKVRVIHKVLCMVFRIKQVSKITQTSSKHRSQIFRNNNSFPISQSLTSHTWIKWVVMGITHSFRTLRSDLRQEWVLKLFDLC